MSRPSRSRDITARGAHFLRETVSRVRYGGASGQLTVRADSGFYTHAVVAVCRRMDVRFSITIRQHASLRNLIEAIPDADWTPIPYWMDGAAAVAETTYTPFQSEPNTAPVRLIVRRVKPTPGSQLALFATYSYHGFTTNLPLTERLALSLRCWTSSSQRNNSSGPNRSRGSISRTTRYTCGRVIRGIFFSPVLLQTQQESPAQQA